MLRNSLHVYRFIDRLLLRNSPHLRRFIVAVTGRLTVVTLPFLSLARLRLQLQLRLLPRTPRRLPLRLLPCGNRGAQHVQAQLELVGRRHLVAQESSLRGAHPEPAAFALSFQSILQLPPTIL